MGEGVFLSSVNNSQGLRPPSMHHDGTPIQLSASLQANVSGGVRVAFEPGSLAEPVSKQIRCALGELENLLGVLGWSTCFAAIDACSNAVFPAEQEALDALWGGIWLGVVQHSQYTGIRVYFNLRSADAFERWRRIGKFFATLSGMAVCPVMQEMVLLAAESVMPVGIGLDLLNGSVVRLKVYFSIPAPFRTLFYNILPPSVAEGAGSVLDSFLQRFEPESGLFPPHSVTVAYDVSLDLHGRPQKLVRYKFDVDVSRLLYSDDITLKIITSLCQEFNLRIDDLAAILAGIPRSDKTGHLFQYVGIGLTEKALNNLNVYIRPPGLFQELVDA